MQSPYTLRTDVYEAIDPKTLANSLKGKNALVTGSGRGIGREMAIALSQAGANVIVRDRTDSEINETIEAITSLETGTKTVGITADVLDRADQARLVRESIEKLGQIDILVTSAGFTENFDAINYPFDRMQKLWGVNVDGTYLFATGVAKHLMARKAPGSIVMIGSMSGSIVNVPQPQAPYNAAKAAVRHLAASLAVEWAGQDIRVNCISPGYMLTALTRKILDENPQLRDKWTSLIPVGKMGTPEDLMGAVTFLLSDASKYITGADLRVDGGYTLT